MAMTQQGGDWRATGERTIRARSETNRILTLTLDTLDETDLGEEPVAFYARKGEIRAYRWEDGIPQDVCEARHRGEEPFLACGVREIHTSGTSTVVTITEDALGVAGFAEGTPVQQWSIEAGVKLTPDGPDLADNEAAEVPN